jgi:hypothetical protein
MKNINDMNSKWKIKYLVHNIYIMKNHNWAFSAWEFARLENKIKSGATLLHVDFHDDYCKPLEKVRKVETKEEALRIGEELEIFEFIKAAEGIGTIKDIYMIGDYNSPPEGVFHAYTLNQFENEYRMKFFNNENTSFILDLDLDFFNLHAYQGIERNYDDNPFRYSNEYIKHHMERFKQYYDDGDLDLITVSISPEHCGGAKTSQEILDIFLEVFELANEQFISW